VASQGYVQSSGSARYQISAYLTPFEFENTTAVLSLASCEDGAEESVRVPAGEFRVRHVTRKTEKETADWWVDVKLGVPVKGRIGDIDYVLTKLEVSK
jgi:hypothetical protein